MAVKFSCKPGCHIFALITVILNVILLSTLLVVALREDTTEQDGGWSGGTIVERILKAKRNDRTLDDTTQLQHDLTSFYGAPKPACHLDSVPSSTDKNGVVTLHWQNLSKTTFIEHGLVYEDGSVLVNQGGYYYIYSQITYQGNGTEDLDHGRIIHRIRKRKHSEEDESPTTLLQNFQSTPTIRRGRHAYITSSLGGTFYLEKYSRVYVMSSVPRNIDRSPLRTYYGLFLA